MTDKTMKMSEALDLLGALRSLDGMTKSARDGERSVVIFEAYKFPAKAKIKIARNIGRLTETKHTYERAYEMTRVEVCQGEKDPVKLAGNETFTAKLKDLLEQDIEVSVDGITWDELDLDANPIPNTVLHVLMPLIEQEDGK